MNGVHDMGGMHGFGAILPEVNEPVFHAEWEARVFALQIAMAAWGRWSIDASRHAREVIPPSEYLRLSYYERWLISLEALSLRTSLVSAEELITGRPDGDSPRATPPLRTEFVAAMLAAGAPSERSSGATPRFTVGQGVRARQINPVGHTRLPRYVRGHAGTVTRAHGAHVFPDSSAHGLGEEPQHLYAVRFEARELWGPEANPIDTVSLDLWEAYLDSA